MTEDDNKLVKVANTKKANNSKPASKLDALKLGLAKTVLFYNNLKKNWLIAAFFYVIKKLFWLCVFISLAYLLIQLYGDTATINEDEKEKLEGYKTVMMILNPANEQVNKGKDDLLSSIAAAESDGKVTVSEFVEIEGKYRRLEEFLMKLAVARSSNADVEASNSKPTQDSVESAQ